MTNEREKLVLHWPDILTSVKKEKALSQVAFDIWLAPLKIGKVQDHCVVIVVPLGSAGLAYVEMKFRESMKLAIRAYMGEDYEIKLVLPEDSPMPEKKRYREEEIREDYHKLTRYLIEHKLTITTMESATSGQIASLITDTEGSSAVLKGAYVTYCNAAKIMQGVPAEILEKYTVYSRETAEAMAKACAASYQADIGIGVTGTMGNVDPANPEASVPGQVYFAISIRGNLQSYYVELEPQPTRLLYKLAVAEEIYDVLAEKLECMFENI